MMRWVMVGVIARKLLGIILALALGATACGGSDAGEQASSANVGSGDGGTVVVAARADWDTGFMQAEIYSLLLTELGYEVVSAEDHTLSPDDFYAAVGTGEVDFWANGWFPLHDGRLVATGGAARRVGDEMPIGGVQGYVVDLLTSEDKGVSDITQLRNAEVASFFDLDKNGKADLIGCPEGWGCHDTINTHIKEFGLSATVEQRSGEDYNSQIVDDVASRLQAGLGVLFYTWTPNYTLAKFQIRRDVSWLSAPNLPGEDSRVESLPGCPDPCQLGWEPNDIGVVANSEFLDANPSAEKLFEQVQIPAVAVYEQNLAMFDGESSQADLERHAADWIAENRDQVAEWLAAARSAA